MEPTHAIVEIMGHRSHAGLVSEVEMFGGKLMQIITPELPELPETSRSVTRNIDHYDESIGRWVVYQASGRYVSPLVPAVPSERLLYGAASIFSVKPCTQAEALEYAGRDRAYRNEEWIPDAREPLALPPAPTPDEDEDANTDDDCTDPQEQEQPEEDEEGGAL